MTYVREVTKLTCIVVCVYFSSLTQFAYFLGSFELVMAAFTTTACLTQTYAIIFGSYKYEVSRAQARISSQLIGSITCRSSRIHLSNNQGVCLNNKITESETFVMYLV